MTGWLTSLSWNYHLLCLRKQVNFVQYTKNFSTSVIDHLFFQQVFLPGRAVWLACVFFSGRRLSLWQCCLLDLATVFFHRDAPVTMAGLLPWLEWMNERMKAIVLGNYASTDHTLLLYWWLSWIVPADSCHMAAWPLSNFVHLFTQGTPSRQLIGEENCKGKGKNWLRCKQTGSTDALSNKFTSIWAGLV